jgi:asparagine synthase (glutamine-hydrolysing)
MLYSNGFVAVKGKIPQEKLEQLSLGHRAWRGSRILSPTDNITILTNPLASASDSDQLIIHGSFYSQDAENLVIEAFKKNDLADLSKTLARLPGDYCVLNVQGEELVYSRSPPGVVPLYAAFDAEKYAVATEMKPLVALGLDNVHSVQPGRLISTPPPERRYTAEPKIEVPVQDDIEEVLIRTLQECVKVRVQGKRQVALGFSGGLDSSLLAYIAQQYAKVKLVGLTGNDASSLKAAASLLSLDLIELSVDEAMVSGHLPFLSYLIETKSVMDLSIGMAMHLDAKLAYHEGCDTLVLGQLADELFGGYSKYSEALSKYGSQTVEEQMNRDVEAAHQTGFPRDDKALSPFVTMSIPYADVRFIKLVLTVPAMKRIGIPLHLRKNLLRKIALRIGLPSELAMQPKKAVQYATGLEKRVRRLIRLRPNSIRQRN